MGGRGAGEADGACLQLGDRSREEASWPQLQRLQPQSGGRGRGCLAPANATQSGGSRRVASAPQGAASCSTVASWPVDAPAGLRVALFLQGWVSVCKLQMVNEEEKQ